MSRFNFAIVASLVASLSSAAIADAPMKFAQPPSTSVSSPAAVADLPSAVRLDRAAIRAKLAHNRAANLARFRVYQNKGVFPSNTYTDGKLNIWLDELGNLCAAATIMKLSGEDDLVQRTAATDNFIRLVDVTQGPLMDWILTSGLTQDEIVAIQEPMMRVTQDPTPILVDARMRRIEDRRLIHKYKQVDAQIVKSKHESLDAATDRLLSNPDLARKFLAS